jgi:hypothetical protein
MIIPAEGNCLFNGIYDNTVVKLNDKGHGDLLLIHITGGMVPSLFHCTRNRCI